MINPLLYVCMFQLTLFWSHAHLTLTLDYHAKITKLSGTLTERMDSVHSSGMEVVEEMTIGLKLSLIAWNAAWRQWLSKEQLMSISKLFCRQHQHQLPCMSLWISANYQKKKDHVQNLCLNGIMTRLAETAPASGTEVVEGTRIALIHRTSVRRLVEKQHLLNKASWLQLKHRN